MGKADMGCCGAYCGTCKVKAASACKGCGWGYAEGLRELEKAKCPVKRCGLGKGFSSCAECPEAESCGILGEFHGRNGEKYRKYRQAIQYIRRFGYPAFFAVADGWKDAKGKYPVLK